MSRAIAAGAALLVVLVVGGCGGGDGGDDYLNVPLRADLIVADIEQVGTPGNDKLEIEVQVHNQGTSASVETDLTVRYRALGDLTWIPIGTFTVVPLGYSETDFIEVSADVPADGSYEVECTVEPIPREDFTGNNTTTETFVVTKPGPGPKPAN